MGKGVHDLLPPVGPYLRTHRWRIGEIAKLLGETPATIRYWDREFKLSSGRHNGQRIWNFRDFVRTSWVQEALRSQHFTIEGARVVLKRRCAVLRIREKRRREAA